MKKAVYIWSIMLVFFLGAPSLWAQSKQEKKEQREKEVKEWIDGKRFTIEVDRALPLRGRSVHLTSPYSLELRGDSVFSYLPYFGRAYSAPYGGGNGMRFEEVMTDYTLSYGKKGKAILKFETRTDDDKYTFFIEIYPNGSATIQVNSVNKQSIGYQGEITGPKD